MNRHLPFDTVRPRWAAYFVLAIVACVWVGWLRELSFGDGIFRVAMNPLSAIAFALLAIGQLLCLQFESPRLQLLGRVFGLGAAILGFLRLLGFAGWDLELDRIFFADQLQGPTPNRMAPNTAIGFVLFGVALFFVHKQVRRGFRICEWLALAGLLLSATVLAGYFYSSSQLTAVAQAIPMAFHTAAAFFIFGIGFVSMYRDRGWLGVFQKPYAGATVGRRILPFVLLAPLLFGWIKMRVQTSGALSTELAAATFAVIGAVSGVTILWIAVAVINKLEETIELKSFIANELKLSRLKRFFPPAISQMIASGEIDDPFKWHRTDVTVVFVDIRGFTSFVESAEPHEVMVTIQDYYRTIARAAQRHNGSIGHMAADGVMVFFNDPVPVARPQVNAVRMALELRKELDQLCAKWRTRNLDFSFGAGLASGFATVGGIGAEGFWDYTVIGSTPNIASRLCGIAKPGQILVSRKFLSRIEDVVVSDPVGALHLKGLREPVTTFNVVEFVDAQEARAASHS